MSGNTVTITSLLADELRLLLLEAQRMPAIRHEAAELAERLGIAVRLAAEVANSRPPAQLIPLPSQPAPEAANTIESHVARTMLDMPPPVSVSVVVSGAHSCSFDTWSPPQVGETLCMSSALAVRVVVVRRDVLKPNVLHVTATILYDDRGGPF